MKKNRFKIYHDELSIEMQIFDVFKDVQRFFPRNKQFLVFLLYSGLNWNKFVKRSKQNLERKIRSAMKMKNEGIECVVNNTKNQLLITTTTESGLAGLERDKKKINFSF